MTYSEVLYAGILLMFGGGLLIITTAFLASRKVKQQPVPVSNNVTNVQDHIRYENRDNVSIYDYQTENTDYYHKSSLTEISNERYPEYSYEYREAEHSNEFEYRKIRSPRLRVINNFEN